MSTPGLNLNPVRSRCSERRLRRAPLIAAAFIRSRVGDRFPDCAVPHGASPGVPLPQRTAGRAMPSAGTGDCERPRPADGPRAIAEDMTMSTRVVVLARARRSSESGRASKGGPPRVHAYRVRADQAPSANGDLHAPAGVPCEPAPWVSVCGAPLAPADAEIVDQFVGAPCATCAMVAIVGSDVAPVSREEAEGPPAAAITTATSSAGAEIPAASESTFAMSWRERVVHVVAPGAPCTQLDGGTLALGLCGGLGWWPCHPPGSWNVCSACTEQTA